MPREDEEDAKDADDDDASAIREGLHGERMRDIDAPFCGPLEPGVKRAQPRRSLLHRAQEEGEHQPMDESSDACGEGHQTIPHQYTSVWRSRIARRRSDWRMGAKRAEPCRKARRG